MRTQMPAKSILKSIIPVLAAVQAVSPAAASGASADASGLVPGTAPLTLKLAFISTELFFFIAFGAVVLFLWNKIDKMRHNREKRSREKSQENAEAAETAKSHALTAAEVNRKARALLDSAQKETRHEARHSILLSADRLFSDNSSLGKQLDKKAWSTVCMLLAEHAHTPLERIDYLKRCHELGVSVLATSETLHADTIAPFIHSMLELGKVAATPQERIDLYTRSAKALAVTHHDDFSPLLYKQNPAGTYAESLHGAKADVRFRLTDGDAVDPLALWQVRHYEGAALALAAREMEAGLQRESMLDLAARRLAEYLKTYRYQGLFKMSEDGMLARSIDCLTIVTNLAPKLPTPWYALALLNESRARQARGTSYQLYWRSAVSALQQAMLLLPGVDELLFAHAGFLAECPADNLAGWWMQHGQAMQTVQSSLDKNRSNVRALYTKASVLCSAAVVLGEFLEAWMTQPESMTLLERVDEAFKATVPPFNYAEPLPEGEGMSLLEMPVVNALYDSPPLDTRFGSWDRTLRALYPSQNAPSAQVRLEAASTEFPEDSFEAFIQKSRQQSAYAHTPVKFESSFQKTPSASEFHELAGRVREDLLKDAERLSGQMLVENAVCPECFSIRGSIALERSRFAGQGEDYDALRSAAMFNTLMTDCHYFARTEKTTALWSEYMQKMRMDSTQAALWKKSLEDCSRLLKVKIQEAEEHRSRQKPTREEAALLAGYYFHCGETLRHQCFAEAGNNDLYILDLRAAANDMYMKAEELESGCSAYGLAALAAADGLAGEVRRLLDRNNPRVAALLHLVPLDPDLAPYWQD